MINPKIIKSQSQLTIILVVITLSVFLLPISPFSDISDLTQSSNNTGEDEATNLQYSSRTGPWIIPSISDTGDPITVNQFANYNETEVEVSVNGSTPLYMDSVWQMYQYRASVYNLTDTKEWIVNGSFEEAYNPWVNDSNDNDGVGEYINNMVTYWTGDPAHAGEPTGGDKCIYMQLDGNLTAGNYYYDLGDSVYWYEDVLIDRDHPSYAALSFVYYLNKGYQGTPPKLDLYFYINDTPVYSFKLRNMILSNWQTSGVITTVGFDTLAKVLDDYIPGVVRFMVSLNITGDISPGSGETGADSQQIYVDNVTLSMMSHAYPSALKLQTRLRANNGNTGNFSIIDTDYGTGNIIINPSPYLTTTVIYEYVDVDYFTNSSNSVSLKCDMTSYATKLRDTQTDRQSVSSYGAKFSASNGTYISWECYYLVSIPGDYGVNFWNFTKSIDWNLTQIYNPSMVSVIDYVEGGNIGDNYVLINMTIGGSEGFWELHFSSPNYVEESWNQIQDGTSWYNTTLLLVGNTTRGVGQLLMRGVGQPQANLTVFDPHGNVWYSEFSSVDALTGRVNFSNHLVTTSTYGGTYASVILWHNGTEAGYFGNDFLIIHNSGLTPESSEYELEAGEATSSYIKVRFRDLDNGTDIYYPDVIPQEPSITGNWTGASSVEFSWLVTGGEAWYVGSYDISGLSAGYYYTTITAVADGYADTSTGSPAEVNTTVKISIVLETNYDLSQAVVLVSYDDQANFSVYYNYYDGVSWTKVPGAQVELSYLGATWSGGYIVQETANSYVVILNTQGVDAGSYYPVWVNATAPGYESQKTTITVSVKGLPTSLIAEESTLTVEPGEDAVFEAIFNDNLHGEGITGANITYDWYGDSGQFEEVGDGVYRLTIPTNSLDEGTYYINVTASLKNYESQSLQFSLVIVVPRQDGGISSTAFIGLAAAVGIALTSFFTWYAHFRIPLVVRIINRNISQIKTGQIPPPSNMPLREEKVKSLVDEGLKEDLKILVKILEGI